MYLLSDMLYNISFTQRDQSGPLCASFSRFKPESVFVASLICTKVCTDPYTHKHTHTALIQTQVVPCPTASSPGPQVFTDSCAVYTRVDPHWFFFLSTAK